MKKLAIMFAMSFVLVVLYASSALAVNGTVATPIANDTSYINSGGSLTAYGGNITNVSMNTTVLTLNWQAFYGDIVETVILADNSGNTLFDFGDQELGGWLFFANSSSITWSTVASVDTVNHTEAEDTELGFTSSEADSVNQTFGTVITHDAVSGVGAVVANSAFGVETNDGSGSAFWDTIFLTEDNNSLIADKIYAARISQNDANNNYRNQQVDFQALVPATPAGRTYYVFSELS